MKFRALALPVALMLTLAGCTPDSGAQPTPTPSGPSAAVESSPSAPADPPAPVPTAAPLTIPETCDALVPIDVVQQQFSTKFAPVAYVAHPEDEIGQNFADRNGLNCIWAIPRSEAFVAVYVAERATASDAAQMADWQSAGFTDCSPLLDACFHEEEETMVNIMQTVYALAGGYELRVRASAGSVDPLLAVATEAATNLGYN